MPGPAKGEGGRPRTLSLPGDPKSEGNPELKLRVPRDLIGWVRAMGGQRFILEILRKKKSEEEIKNV